MRNAIYNSDLEDDGSESCAIPSTAATRRRTTASGVGLSPDYEPERVVPPPLPLSPAACFVC